jgi:thiol-disulfide isomerase/thioredoxin
MNRKVLCAALLIMLGGCQKAAAPHLSHAADAGAPPGIAWFEGSLDEAFATARQDHRPLLIFWGAKWCPFCRTLKATVFPRPDFIAKSKLFVPVYLDGDDPGAQRWGERFQIQGYPTLIILDPDRHELLRLGAGREVGQYAAALDVALEDVQPVDALLQQAAGGKALTPQECRRLAFNSWELDTIDASGYATRAAALGAAAGDCPADAPLERAALRIYAAYYAANAEDAPAGQPQPRPSLALAALQDQVDQVLSQHDLALDSAGALAILDDSFFKLVRARGGTLPEQMRTAYAGTMREAADDSRYAVADQLGFIDAELRALKDLGAPKAPLPADAVAMAHRRVDSALAAEQNPFVRSGLVNASLDILEDAGDLPGAYAVAQAEIPRASTPYYYEADLAEIAEKMGRKDEALTLLDRAYHESQGAATRFQWGQLYVSGLLRMAPADTGRIENAGESVIGELDGPDRIYRRARVRLEKLDRELRAWNDSAKGAHTDVLQALHGRMQQICTKLKDTDASRPSCESFLKSA